MSNPVLTLHSLAASVKRFYKKTNVLYNDGKFEVTLDQRKLKTPKGTTLQVESEPLAIAVATEWDAQKEIINQSNMHLTSLVNTYLDNPNNLSKLDLVNYMVDYLPTDTVLYQSEKDDDLYRMQHRDWDPMIQWFNERFLVEMKKNRDIYTPVVSGEIRMRIAKHLMSYDEPCLHAFVYAVDVLKSVILACACIDRFVSVERAVFLSRLEEEYQCEQFGRVEWCHDMSQQDSQARLAAAVLFIHLHTTREAVKQKSIV